MEIEWTETDPLTGGRRFVRAEKFARKWRFKVRARRRTEWDRDVRVTRAMWETLLDALERRYQRREGVSDADLRLVRTELAVFRDPPAFDGEEGVHHKDTGTTEQRTTEKGED
jgi:hypothetical protein